MNAIHLEVTYEDGSPWVAYLYLPRETDEKSEHSVEVERGMVLDLSKNGKLIGIELLAPQLVTLDSINAVLEQYGLEPISEDVLRPLLAA